MTPRSTALHWSAILLAALMCGRAVAQSLEWIRSLPEVAADLESVGVRDDPLELARSHTAYAQGLHPQLDPFEEMTRGWMWMNDDVDSERFLRAWKRAESGATDAERALLNSVLARNPEHARELEALAPWWRVRRLATKRMPAYFGILLPDPLLEIERFVPEPADRAALIVDLAPVAAALAQTLRGMHDAQWDHRIASRHRAPARIEEGRVVEERTDRDRAAEAAWLRAFVRAIAARWRLEESIAERLEEPMRSRRLEAFLRQASFDFGQFQAEGDWIDPEQSGARATLVRLRAGGAVTPEVEPAVRDLVRRQVAVERRIGRRLMEALAAVEIPDPGAASRDPAAAIFPDGRAPAHVPFMTAMSGPQSELRSLRAAIARELATVAGASWLIDPALPQPSTEGIELSPEDEAIVGRKSQLEFRFGGSARGLESMLPEPPIVDSVRYQSLLARTSLTEDERALALEIVARSTGDSGARLAACRARASAAAVELLHQETESMFVGPRRGVAPRSVEESRALAKGPTEAWLAARREAWAIALAAADASTAELRERIGPRIDAAMPSLSDLARIDMAWRIASSTGGWTESLTGGLAIDPIAVAGAAPFARRWAPNAFVPLRPASEPPGDSSPSIGSAPRLEPSLLVSVARELREGADQINDRFDEVLERHLARVLVYWITERDEEGRSPDRAALDEKWRRLGAEIAPVWRTAQRRAIESMLEVAGNDAAELDRAFVMNRHPVASGPLAGLLRLRRELAEAGVDGAVVDAACSLVQPEIEARFGEIVTDSETPLAPYDPESTRSNEDHMARSSKHERLGAWMSMLAKTPSWLLRRTLRPDTIAKCPSLRSTGVD